MAVVKGVTKSGIKYQLETKIKDDARLLYLLTKAQNSKEPLGQGKAVMDLLTLIFGSDEGVYTFMNEVADKHKGVCGVKDMLSELQEMLDSLNAKNS